MKTDRVLTTAAMTEGSSDRRGLRAFGVMGKTNKPYISIAIMTEKRWPLPEC